MTPPVTQASYHGFDTADPLVSFTYSGSGASYGPGDYGAGLNLSLGSLGLNQSVSFNVFEGVNKALTLETIPTPPRWPYPFPLMRWTTEDPAGLASDMASAGATWTIVGQSESAPWQAWPGLPSFPAGYNSVALGYGPSSEVPEPGATVLFVAALGLLAFGRRRKPADA